jgi:hypothetical protein
MTKQKPFVSYHGVTIYQTFKGREVLSYWYAIEPGQNEDSDQAFDIRRLPKAYRSGLMIERDNSSIRHFSPGGFARFMEAREEEKDAHQTALQRAIDDGYDFSSAIRGNYGQFLRRIFRYARRSFGKQRTG